MGLSFKNENLSVSDLELNVGIDSVVVFKQRTIKSDLSLIITDQAKEKRRPKRIYFISREIFFAVKKRQKLFQIAKIRAVFATFTQQNNLKVVNAKVDMMKWTVAHAGVSKTALSQI